MELKNGPIYFFTEEKESFTKNIENGKLKISDLVNIELKIKTGTKLLAGTASLVTFRINNKRFRINALDCNKDSDEKDNTKKEYTDIIDTSYRGKHYDDKGGIDIDTKKYPEKYKLLNVSIIELRNSIIEIMHNQKGDRDDWLILYLDLYVLKNEESYLYKSWVINKEDAGEEEDAEKENFIWIGDDGGSYSQIVLQQGWLFE